MYTMEPPIVDPSTKGDNIIEATLQRTQVKVQKICFPIVQIHFEPLMRGQPLYKGHNN